MIKKLLFILFSLILYGCALPPPDISGQSFVPEDDLSAVRFVKEGLRYMSAGRYLDAEMRFRKAEYIEPNSIPVQQNIAVSLMKQERYSEAGILFDSLRSKDPLSLPLMVWLGKAKYAEGRRDEGIAVLNRAYSTAIERDDAAQIAAIARSLSALYFAQGNEMDAVCLSSSAASLSFSSIDVYRHARLLLGLGFPQNSSTFIEASQAAGIPKIRELIVLQALNYFARRDFESSLGFVKEAFLSASDNPESELILKLLVYLNVKKLKTAGRDINQDIVDEDLFQELLLDPILQGSLSLYLPKNLLDLLIVSPI